MTEWRKVKLGDILEIKHGYAFSGEHIIEEDNNIVLVTPGNFRIGGGFQEKKCKFFDGEIPQDYILKEGDFIVTMTDLSKTIDTLGYSALVPKSKKRTYLHNQRIGLVQFKNDECDKGYIYWLMRTHDYQRVIANTSTGSTVHHTSPSKICDYECKVPSKTTQHNIAIILFRYDALIENYQNQIKLLEESAQRLYKEWFVDLRFPGYEKTKVVDGVPEGWKVKKLIEICDVNITNISKSYAFDYLNYTDLGNVREGIIQGSTRYNYGQEPGRAKRVAKDGDIIWGMVRPNLKSYALIQNPKPQDVFSTGFAVLSAHSVPFTLLYCAITTDSFVGYLVNCTNGAAYPAVKPEHFENAKILVPSKDICDLYNIITEPLFRKSSNISIQIHLLTEARDRLLPKLMSGEIKC